MSIAELSFQTIMDWRVPAAAVAVNEWTGVRVSPVPETDMNGRVQIVEAPAESTGLSLSQESGESLLVPPAQAAAVQQDPPQAELPSWKAIIPVGGLDSAALVTIPVRISIQVV